MIVYAASSVVYLTIRKYAMCSFLNFVFGNTHDYMLFAKHETVCTGSGAFGSSVVSFTIFSQIPCQVNVGIEKLLNAPVYYFSLLFCSLFSTWVTDFPCGLRGWFLTKSIHVLEKENVGN